MSEVLPGIPSGYEAVTERVRVLNQDMTEVRGEIRNMRTAMVTREDLTAVSSEIKSLSGDIKQQQKDAQPNTIGWIIASLSAIAVSLTIVGSFGSIWKSSIDDRFISLLTAVREVRADTLASDKEFRGVMLTRDEYDKRATTEVARRQDQFNSMGARVARDEDEITRLRENSATKSDRDLIINRVQDAFSRLNEELRVHRERLDYLERRRPPTSP